MSLFLAVDAGGTKTEFLLADNTRELARVRTGTIKRLRTDAATAARNLDAGLAELTLRSGLSLRSITSTCVGAAGSSVPLVSDWLQTAFATRIPGPVCLIGDVEIALDAAFTGGPGIVVIAGTGSNVAGRDLHRAVSTVGGWGPALSDQASGHRVGLQALRALFLAIDEARAHAPPRRRAPPLEPQLGIPSLVELSNRLPSPDFSELAPVVVSCAQRGDRVALSVIAHEAEELAHLVHLLGSRLTRTSPDPAWLPEIAFAGSMLEHVPLLRKSLVAALHRKSPQLTIRPDVVDPLLGALWRARAEA